MDKTASVSPLYNIGVVTRLTGIPSATLHAWERRYGFPHAVRTPGGHRLYSEDDITRLRWVKSQVDLGLTISRAVIAVRNLEADGRLLPPVGPEAGQKSPLERPDNGSEAGPAASLSLRESLLDALIHHNLARADQLMGEMLAFYSPEYMTLEIIGPILNAIGSAWEQGNISIATEHLASNFLRHRLQMWMLTGTPPKPVNPIVLACAPGEWHEGSLLMLGVLLRRQGWPVSYLGQNVPFHDLAKFIDAIHPPAVVLVAMGEEAARSLAEWPKWIHPLSGYPVVTFGGRAFVIQPELLGVVRGIYLGATIPEGLKNLVSLVQQVE